MTHHPSPNHLALRDDKQPPAQDLWTGTKAALRDFDRVEWISPWREFIGPDPPPQQSHVEHAKV